MFSVFPFYRILIAAACLPILAGCGSTGSHQLPPDVDVSTPHTPHYTIQNSTIQIPARNTNQPSLPAQPFRAPAPATNNTAWQRPVHPSNPEPLRGSLVPAVVVERYPLNQTWVPLREWCLANKFSEPKRIASSEGAAYSFNSPNGTVSIQTGSQVVNWCGVSLYLGFAPVLIGGQPSIAALDIRKNFEPLLGMASTHRRGSVIVLDPGHGGTDTGTRNVSNSRPEKEFSLDWALRLKPLLVAQGWTVYMTRSNDTMVKLQDRVAFADSVKADVFLSLHFNSAYPETHELGLETYCIPSRGMPSNLTRGSPDVVSIPLPNNLYDAENIQLGERLHRSILQVNGHQDRGLRRARFLGVLKWQQRPAVLIEGGYLSNPTESRKIADPNYRQQLAVAVASALRLELPPAITGGKMPVTGAGIASQPAPAINAAAAH